MITSLQNYFELINEPMPEDQQILTEYFAWIRHGELKGSDWTQLPDSPLSEEKRAEWAAYRQAWRDLPGQYAGHYEDAVFPEQPQP